MEKLKIIQILKTFSKQELKEFTRFAASPYFNEGRNYTALLNELKKYYPDFSSVKFTKENVYSKLYPGREYKNSVMKTMFSGLNSLAEDYLAQKVFDTNKFEILHAKLYAFNDKNLEKQFTEAIKFASEHFNELEVADPLDALRNRYELSLIEATFYNARRDHNIKNKLFDVTTSVAALFFMEYFVTYADEFAKSNAINQPMPEIIDMIHNSVDFEKIIPVLINSNRVEKYKIEFYYNLYNARRTCNKEFYMKAKATFFDNIDIIPKPTKQSFIFLMSNLLSYLLRINKDELIEKERYELIKYMFEKDLYIFPGNDVLPLGLFRNAFLLSINSGDFAFSNTMMEKHVNYLHTSLIKPYKQYGYALIDFHNRKFENSLQHLQKIELHEHSLKLDYRFLTSKLYFELEYWDSAFSFIESFRKFLSENINISISLREHILGYINYYTEMLRIRTGNRKGDIRYLEKRLENEHLTEGHGWLMQKITEIKNQ